MSTTGQTVRRGEPLLEVYSPDLVLAQREYFVARSAATDMAHADAMARDTISPKRIQMLGVRTEAASLAPHGRINHSPPSREQVPPHGCWNLKALCAEDSHADIRSARSGHGDSGSPD